MSRQPTVLDTFYILDDHCNSNFMGVGVNGRTSEFLDALYCHLQNCFQKAKLTFWEIVTS